jgi:transposase-like protein
MALMIAGTQFWLWRAVDDEGEVLDLLVQRRLVQISVLAASNRCLTDFVVVLFLKVDLQLLG